MTSVSESNRNTRALSMKYFYCVLLSALVASSTGCHEGRPTLVPVSGQVLIDGTPLKHGAIRFAPTDARSSTGELDAEGRFTLTCYEEGDGVVLGRHRVAVMAGESLNEEQTRWHAPKKYANHKTSGIEVEVSEPTSTVIIKLSWEGRQPFVQGTRPKHQQRDVDDED